MSDSLSAYVVKLDKVGALADAVSDLHPSAWRALLVAAAEHRCIACGEPDGCDCTDAVDEAKVLVVDRASELQRET